MNLKDIKEYKSKEYIKWIRDNCYCCVCGMPLCMEKETFETHHHLHLRKNDLMLLPICLEHHNQLHLGKNVISKKAIEINILATISMFVVHKKKFPELMETLTKFFGEELN